MPDPFPEIELVPERGKAYESSLLTVTGQEDSGLLFESLQESLGINQFASPRGLLIPSAEASHFQGAKQNNIDSSRVADEGSGEGVKPSSTSSGDGVKVPGGPPMNAADATSPRQLRKSTRIRRERVEDETNKPKPTKSNVRFFVASFPFVNSWVVEGCLGLGAGCCGGWGSRAVK